ncbi:MAG: lysoplasmalogenase [Sphingomonadaceae bacterium]|nr:lysoplasmalogenase [Sphingomonadaceae bacterium]
MNDTKGQASGSLVRIALVLALLSGLSYFVASRMFEPSPVLVVWKGAGVGLLALWAAMQARNLDSWLIAVVMAFGAAGDVLIDAMGLIPGALAFLAGHIVAIGLYLRHRREALAPTQLALAIILVPAVVFIAWSLPENREDALGIALYSFGLAAMAALAWTSRFPRYWVGIGAMLFVASDLLIFARIGPLAGSALPNLLIWPLYFTGQAMIAIGVVRTLSANRAT